MQRRTIDIASHSHLFFPDGGKIGVFGRLFQKCCRFGVDFHTTRISMAPSQMNQNFIRFHVQEFKTPRLSEGSSNVVQVISHRTSGASSARNSSDASSGPSVAWLQKYHQYSSVFTCIHQYAVWNHSAGFVESSKGVTFCHCGKRPLGLTVSVAIFLQPHCLGLSHPEKNEGNL